MAKKLINVDTKANQFSFDAKLLKEVKNSPFKVKNQFIRIEKEDGKMRPLNKGEKADLKSEETHVFTTLAIKGQDIDFCVDLAVLNNMKGFIGIKEVDGDSFVIKDGATVSIVKDDAGVSMVFNG